MNDSNQSLRAIPQVEKLLQTPEIARFIPELGRGIVVKIVRRVIDMFREKIELGQDISVDRLVPSIVMNCLIKRQHKLQRVINGTGVIIHTNLGRAPIMPPVLERLTETMNGYVNLEFHLPTEQRGRRGGYTEELVSHLTGAEDALIVNNCAAALFLILNEFARGREVIVSRGELIQIGGGFRIPDIMNQTGAVLREVGTTNITDIGDVKAAITDETAMILSAHHSNFAMQGFTGSPSLKELSSLAGGPVVLVRDLGSGNMVADERLPAGFESTVRQELSQGMDILCFSGDKLLGACQAGIIVGRKELIARMRRNPLMRVLRVDKITYFILQETLLAYEGASAADVPIWSMILHDKKDIGARITRVLRAVHHEGKSEMLHKVPLYSAYGGGSMPVKELESAGLQIVVPGVKAERLYSAFINEEVPVIGTIVNDSFTLDFMTIFDRDVPAVASSIDAVLDAHHRSQ